MDAEKEDRAKALAAIREREQSAQNLVRKEALLCFRIIQRQEEAREGSAQILRDTFIKNFLSLASEFDLKSDEKFRNTLQKVITSSGRFRLADLNEFCTKISQAFRKELLYKKDRRNQFSLDVLFQTIDLLSTGKSEEGGSLADKDTSDLSHTEKESMLQHFRAYNTMNAKILAQSSLKDALLKREQLEDEVALAFKDLTITSVELIFRNIIAQHLLAKKYRCDTLISEWAKEYGFDEEMKQRVAKYIPPDTALLQFRTKYAQAVQSSKNQDQGSLDVFESDLFLLRSLANYFTSWIMQVSEMISG
ncbi:hypothetical protein LPTSP4_13690 [Leptospira ryugenii]|uniref:Uncharacterized protein n=1 Tax=Leptospira ryugenii TaxID=1917863 RepID=A0A2P2DYZ0_9LEPT|nr:hypothetical protein [Leptospira ryugenii]GBF49849.1 hypothetical protein LPTSP4_13690 [Leptospira ryugenii]